MAGKRTMVVRLGRSAASGWSVVIMAAAFGLLAVLPAFGVSPQQWTLLTFVFFAFGAGLGLLLH